MNIIEPKPGQRVMGISMIIAKNKRTVFLADTSVDPDPNPEQLAAIAVQSAAFVRGMGHEPRVAMLSFSNFGNPLHHKTEKMRKTVEILDSMKLDFEYEGEIMADVALNKELMKLYPFCRLSEPANILIMPGLNTANICSKLLRELGGGILIGPIIIGLEKTAQVVPMNSSVADILNITAIAAVENK